MTSTAALATLLTDPDRNIRLRAAMELGISQDAAAAPALVAALGPELDSRVRGMITWATVQHAGEAIDELVALLQDGDPAVRHQVLHVLSKIGGREILPYVLPAVADEDPQVAIKAYRAAASTDAPEVVPALVARLGDGDDEQRDQLNRALRLLGAWPVEPLADALAAEDPAVRLHAADALAEIGSPDAEPAVIALARTTEDPEAEVRLAAVCALGELEDEDSVEVLRQVATGADQVLARVAGRLLRSRAARAAAAAEEAAAVEGAQGAVQG
ncbi:HEAT repeat [Raineyella antarctica]|uniref:HEAT repeat n=1 Tax=Raineyella antarctica TaxID=1577474 RepID=A0A1G6HEA4_9ACTN|nr:HEAT repeat domain-containing protein [Raineyella antarctica]SDB92599.1 HEAT repeat [Raineyella antarctica]